MKINLVAYNLLSSYKSTGSVKFTDNFKVNIFLEMIECCIILEIYFASTHLRNSQTFSLLS